MTVSSSTKDLWIAMVISSIIHLCLILLLPDINLALYKPKLKIIPVKLLKITSKRLIRKRVSKKRRIKKKLVSKKKKAVDYTKSKLTTKLTRKKNRLKLSSPLMDNSAIKPELATISEELVPVSTKDLFDDDSITQFLPDETISPVRFKEIERIKVTRKEESARTDSRISWGEGIARDFLYRPSPPNYSSKIEGEVKIKFWVSPNGNVTQALPMIRLNAKLEQISIDYIKGWRFAPLPVGVKDIQSGILTLKFQHH